MSPLPLNREARAEAIFAAVAETVRDLTEASPLGGVPSGELYAFLCGIMSLETYQSIIGALKDAKLVRERAHLLEWIGPKEKKGMTIQEAGAIGIPDEPEITEDIPREEIAKVEALPAERHLASGASAMTLCGLPRETVTTAHPSKARKADCAACREALRALLSRKAAVVGAPANERPPKAGDRVAMDDDSAWLVEDAREGGLCLLCLVGSAAHAKGRRTVVSRDSVLRVLGDAAFSELVGREKPAKASGVAPIADAGRAAAPVSEPAAERPRGAIWKPTKADVDEVLRRRALGESYMKIEAAMGWPAGHGNRPFRIAKGAWKYEELS